MLTPSPCAVKQRARWQLKVLFLPATLKVAPPIEGAISVTYLMSMVTPGSIVNFKVSASLDPT